MKENIENILKRDVAAVSAMINAENMDCIENLVTNILGAIQKGNKVLLCGNGGSAADSQHIAAEFVGRFKLERKGYPAIALTTDTSIITAIGNDYSFNEIFSRQVEALGNKGDVLIGISTSGNSENVIQAVRLAKEKGLLTAGFTGKDGGALAKCVDLHYNVSAPDSASIQAGHIIAMHTVCEIVEKKLVKL